MEATEINFDDEAVVKERATEKVEITVGELWLLLTSYYSGGGEPDSLNARLKCAKTYPDYL